MPLRIGSRVFAPRLLPTLLLLPALALLAWLGTWQLERANEKRAQLAAFEQHPVTRVALPSAADAASLPRYARVRLAGRYLADRQFLLDNMTHAGTAGYRVLTPFASEAGATVLIDRGWIPQGLSRARLPDVAVGPAPRAVAGRIDELPRPGIRLAGVPGSGWPRVVSFPRVGELADLLGAPLYPRVLLLDPSDPDGFLREWRPAGAAPERHVGYALQWYGLALTLAVAYLVACLRRRGPA